MSYDPVTHGARCSECPLRNAEEGPLAPRPAPSGKTRLVVVGETVHRSDCKMGEPFSSQSGQLVRRELVANRIPDADTHFTNAVLCRAETDKQGELAATFCAPRLLAEIADIPEDVPILTMGRAPMQSVLATGRLAHGRGFVWKAPAIDPKVVGAAARLAERTKEMPSGLKTSLRATVLALRAGLAGRTVLPTMSQGFFLGAETWHPVFKIDIARAARAVRGELPEVLDDEGPYDVVSFDTPEKAKALLDNLSDDMVSFDIETDGVKVIETKCLCVGFSDGDNTVVLWPWKDSHAPLLAEYMASRKTCVAHNNNFDVGVLTARGVSFDGISVNDTMVAHHTYASHLPQRLAQLVSEYCDSGPWKIKFGKDGADEKGSLPVVLAQEERWEELTRYNAADARLTAKVWKRLQHDLKPEMNVYEADLELNRLCRNMGVVGIGVDHNRKRELSILLRKRMSDLKKEMIAMVGDPNFSPRKHADVRRVLYSQFRARYSTITKTGKPSTANAALEAMASLDTPAGRFAKLMIQFRVVDKIRSTYIGGSYISWTDEKGEKHESGKKMNFDNEFIYASTSRAHYNWKALTVSGRLNSRIMSAPKWNKYDLAARVREIYVPRPGCKFVYFDVSQAEMRLAAYLSGDPVFIAACGGDVHAANAKMLFPEIAKKGWLDGDAKKDPQRGKPFRDLVKNVGFAVSYVAEADKIFAMLNSSRFDPGGNELYPAVSFQAARLIHARLHAAYRLYYKWVDANLEEVKRVGYMRSLKGRKRVFGWRAPKVTEIANYPIQAGLADIMNERMIRLEKLLPEGARYVAQLHDAVYTECPAEEVDNLKRTIQSIWNEPVRMKGGDCVFPIDLKSADRWAEL